MSIRRAIIRAFLAFERWLEGCKHDWEYLKTNYVFWGDRDKYPTRVEYVYLCQKCKMVKKVNT
jgi:hypothetical protein